MDIIKYAVVGTGRGKTFMTPAECVGMKLTAVCDRRPEKLAIIKSKYDKDGTLETYTDYDEMLAKADIDAVVLANYFNEHGEFAIKALKAGKHVMSECIAMGTLAEGVELCRTVEQTGKIYMIAENYPFTKERMEMRRLYKSGELGEMLYGEGEYAHPMSAETSYNYAPGLYHWRNQIPSTYYCTHAIGPVMYITDTMPVRVNGFVPLIKDQSFRGDELRLQDPGGIIMCQMDNGAVVRTLQGAVRVPSRITAIHGTMGGASIDRETGNLTVWHESFNKNGNPSIRTYAPDWPEHADLAGKAGHGGGDFWTMFYFSEAIRSGEQPYLNVYRACAMSCIGILAWKSAIGGGIPYDVPKWDDEEDRKKYENDYFTPFRKEGQDDTGMPPRTLSPWKPTAAAYEKAKAAWEANDYMGLGWSKKDADMAFAKIKV